MDFQYLLGQRFLQGSDTIYTVCYTLKPSSCDQGQYTAIRRYRAREVQRRLPEATKQPYHLERVKHYPIGAFIITYTTLGLPYCSYIKTLF